MPFIWQGDSLFNRWEPYAAQLIPVSINEGSKVYYMQFDLGASKTFFYKDVRDNYAKRIVLHIGKQRIRINEPLVLTLDSTYKDPRKNNRIEIIGTIGTDFIKDKVVSIDFVRQVIHLINNINCLKGEKGTAMNKFSFLHGRILLTGNLLSKDGFFFYDSGTSSFELITDKNTFEALALDSATFKTGFVNSWGRSLKVNTTASQSTIRIGTVNLPLKTVSYVENPSFEQVQMMKNLGIIGLIGNRLFIKGTLLLDMKKQLFEFIQ
ncbi:MAG: hypothetical protein J7539_03085 [Niabella sp.]|nr:hypothetical protein [Niabella sp.]